MKYNCEICDYITNNQEDYIKHIKKSEHFKKNIKKNNIHLDCCLEKKIIIFKIKKKDFFLNKN